MQAYDAKVPPSLKELQTWFGSIISQPLSKEGGVRPLTVRKKPIEEEANNYILKSPTLKPFQRIEIYNQQYWWRLLNTLHDFFPFLTRLFGYHDFNQTIAIPYLLAHRPVHWSLNTIGEKMPGWIGKNYNKKDKKLVFDAALLDCAFLKIFFKEKYPSFTAREEELDHTLYLQPHVALFTFPYNLFAFRKEMNGMPVDHWLEHPFPKLEKKESYFKLFLGKFSNVVWTEIDKTEYLLLQQLKKGATLDALCTFIENQPEEVRQKAETSLQNWFKEWTVHGILTTHAS